MNAITKAPIYDINPMTWADIDPPEGALRGLKVVLIGGPPYSGKDTAGAAITAAIPGARIMKFAEALKRSVYVDAGLPHDLPLDVFDPVKDLPLPVFGGQSFRYRCIEKSERFIKPAYGDNRFGRLFRIAAARNMATGMTLAAVTDSGFEGEALAVIADVGIDNVLVVRVHADGRGKSFAGDSRAYLNLPGARTVDVDNDNPADIPGYQARIVRIAREWLDGGES